MKWYPAEPLETMMKKIVIGICWKLIQSVLIKIKNWFLRESTQWLLSFILLALVMAAYLYLTGCALFSNNIAQCRKACGNELMASFQDGDCVCK